MSRPPIRDAFRLAQLGLEKVALACAAFSLMHASARADESAPPEPATVDQWAAPASAQPVDQIARRTTHDDPWVNPAATRVAHDDPWSVPFVNQRGSGKQLRAAAPARETPAATTQPVPPARPANVLVMDNSDWNEMPRGRSPGLIASNNAWRKRISPEVAAPVRRGMAEHGRRAQPSAILKLDSGLQLDPWSAPSTASKVADNAADWKNLNLASAHQPRTCDRDWSVFASAGCVDSGSPAGPATDNPKPQPLPGARSSKSEQPGSVTMFRQSRLMIDALASGTQAAGKDVQVQPSGNQTRNLIAITPDGRWRAPLVTDAEAAPLR